MILLDLNVFAFEIELFYLDTDDDRSEWNRLVMSYG